MFAFKSQTAGSFNDRQGRRVFWLQEKYQKWRNRDSSDLLSIFSQSEFEIESNPNCRDANALHIWLVKLSRSGIGSGFTF